jgi:hypothetical protein
MAEPTDDNDAWLVDQVGQGRSVDGRTRTGDRLVVTAQALRNLVLAASRLAGLHVSGLKVLGDLNLSYAEIKGPIAITDSEFADHIDCSNAICVSVDLTDSSFPSLDCDGASIQHDVVLRRVSADQVALRDVKVGGNLMLSGATLTGSDGVAMRADRVRVAGGVFCGDGFSATGGVRLIGADIGGQLELTGGRLSNPDGNALIADGIRVAGDVFCGDGFSATGEVRLIGADIGGQLDLSNGRLSNPDGHALIADGIRVAGEVFCGDGFSATGEVRLVQADISSQLDLTDGRFSNADGYALSIERADIGTLLFAATGMERGGSCNLLGAHISYLEDRPTAWQAFGRIQLLDLTYDRINYANWTTKQRLEWLRRAGRHQNQPYEQLASVLRAQGHEREARRVLIAKHTQQRLAQPWYTRFSALFFGGLLAYGYRPLQRTVPLLLGLYLLGAFLLLPQARDHHAVIATRVPVHTTTTVPAGATGQPPQPIAATKHCPADYPCFSSWAYTLDVLIPLVNTHQTDYWTIISKPGDRGAIWYIRLAPALGWILSTAAALGFTGLIRRD